MSFEPRWTREQLIRRAAQDPVPGLAFFDGIPGRLLEAGVAFGWSEAAHNPHVHHFFGGRTCGRPG